VIVILSSRGDLHAVAVQGWMRKLGYLRCHIVECDSIAQGDNLYFNIGPVERKSDRITTSEGLQISISDCKVIWLRRFRANQIITHSLTKDDSYDIINNDCRGAVSGYFSTRFTGRWISHPEATIRASDKLFQLEVAHSCGFRVPKTAVAQSGRDVADFFQECEGQLIVKPIVGADEPFLETKRIVDPSTFSEEAYNASPAIYQECINGRQHLRMLTMGDKSLCGIIETDQLDWRLHLRSSMKPWPVPEAVHKKVKSVLDKLWLEMGIMDIKIAENGELVWLEVNPQGQFLFLEPLVHLPFIDEFSRYLIDEAERSSSRTISEILPEGNYLETTLLDDRFNTMVPGHLG
jgi:hypothetical protein